METNSDYDSFINRITKLNLYLITSSLLLTIFITITIIFLSPNLAYNSIIILVYLIIFGINYSVTNKIKKQQIVDFARLFEIDIDDNYDELNNTISMYKKGEFEKIDVSFTNKKRVKIEKGQIKTLD